MQITNRYISERMIFLAKEHERQSWEEGRKDIKYFHLKQKMPLWAKKVFLSSYNPLFSIWKYRKIEDQSKTPNIHRFSIDFFEYYYNNDICFDIDEYYDNESKNKVLNFIDKKIENFLGLRKYKIDKEVQKKEHEIQSNIKYKNGFYQYKNGAKVYYLPLRKFDYNVFVAKYGIEQLPSEVIKTIEGATCIDVGAYIGDTCLLLQEYSPKDIYAYEPVNRDYDFLLKTVQKNNLTNVIKPVKKGLGNNKSIQKISTSGFSSSIIMDFKKSKETENIEISTIDDEFQDKKVGLIKMDVEGFEYNVISGALNVIKRDKPILLISIYHTGKDFFEILPILKQACPDYKFKYVDTYPADTIVEKVVLAYV